MVIEHTSLNSIINFKKQIIEEIEEGIVDANKKMPIGCKAILDKNSIIIKIYDNRERNVSGVIINGRNQL